MKMQIWSAGLAGALLLAGCATTVNTVENADKAGRRTMITDKRVVTDYSLHKKCTIVGLNTTTADNGFLRVQLEVQNNRDSSYSFFHNIQWFDEAGMRVSTASQNWTEQQIMGRQSLFLIYTAPSVRARDFRVELSEDPR